MLPYPGAGGEEEATIYFDGQCLSLSFFHTNGVPVSFFPVISRTITFSFSA